MNLEHIHITLIQVKPPNKDNYKVIVRPNTTQLSHIQAKLTNPFPESTVKTLSNVYPSPGSL